MDEAYNFRDYWKSLRKDAGCTAEDALWIILDDINRAENEFLYKDHGGRADPNFPGQIVDNVLKDLEDKCLAEYLKGTWK